MEKLVMTDLRSVYQGKKVFLTGHTGFKGAWLLLILKELGAEVKGYALDPKHENDLYNSIRGEELCDSVIADLRDKGRLRKELISFEPDFVFHMAAQALVIDGYEDPLYTYEVNAMGTAYLLDALRGLDKPVECVLITTDKVYENLEKDYAYKEEDRLGGFDPYSNSKACCELIIDSYRNSFFPIDRHAEHKKGIASVRSGNVIGGGDWSDNRIIPDTARALLQNEALIVRNPKAVRPWQHVLDPLYGYLLLGAHMAGGNKEFYQAYNFGPKESDKLTVEELVKLAINVWGDGEYIDRSDPNAVHEANLLMLDVHKAMKELKWSPLYSSPEAIKVTVQWYKVAAGNEREYTLNQIRAYLNEVS